MALQTAPQTNLDKVTVVKWLITLVLPMGILLLPNSDFLTREMALFFCFTLCFLIWAAFELTNLLIPAILWPPALIIFGVVPAAVAYSSWLSLIVPCVITAIILANALDEIGLLKRVSFWIIMKCGGSFNKTMYALFFAMLAISAMTFASGSIIIATLCYGICKSLGVVKTKESAIIMMIGMVAASTTKMFIYYPLMMGAMMGSTATVDPTFTLSLLDLLKYNWPVLFYCLLFIAVMLKLGNTKNSSVGGSKAYFATEYQKLGKITKKEIIACGIVAAIMIFILTGPLHGFDPMHAFIFAAVALYLPGINIGSEKNIRDVPLGTVVFLASCMAIGAVCAALGLIKIISMSLSPLLAALGPISILFGVLGFGFIANLCMTPLAMLAAFSGPILQICVNIGIDPKLVLSTFYAACDMVILPYEYVTFLIFFSFGMMTTGQFIKYHALKDVLYVVFFGLINIPFWYLIGFI